MRGGWDLDALGKFFRRRRRPRLRVPLLVRWILIKSRILNHFFTKMTFGDIYF